MTIQVKASALITYTVEVDDKFKPIANYAEFLEQNPGTGIQKLDELNKELDTEIAYKEIPNNFKLTDSHIDFDDIYQMDIIAGDYKIRIFNA